MAKNFRETLWFKRGELDSEAAAAEDAPAPLPIEDRYLDDNSVTREDSKLFSVRTGSTEYMRRFVVEPDADAAMGTLVGDMKRGRRRVLALIGGTVAMACAFVAMYAF